MAKLAVGATIERGDEDLDRVARDVAAAFPEQYRDRVGDWPLEPLSAYTVGTATYRGLGLLIGAVALLLLAACSNVAHLFLARGLGRGREMAVRRALGAQTGHLVTQLLAESAVVGAAGGALGIVLAWVTLRGFSRWTQALPRGETIAMDVRVLAFGLLLAAVTALLLIRGWGSAEGALGQTLQIRNRERRIIGMAEPTLHYGLDQPHDIAAYIPAWQDPFPIPWGTLAVKLRPGTDGGRLPSVVREAIWSVAPQLPVPTVVPLQSWIDASVSARQFGGVLSTAFGALALLLAAGGLYGTLLYSVGEERRAIGIRLALGAGKGRIERGVVGRALALGAAGVGLGSAAAWYLSRFVEGFLFGVETGDTATLAFSALVLIGTVTAAAWLPARSAAGTDPLETLRVE